MGYIARTDIIARYGEDLLLVLADRDGDGEEDEGVVDQALADADAEIDGYLAKRYTLPLPDVPPLLTRLAVDLAVYHLCNSDTLVTEQRRQRYEDAVALLRRLSSGEVTLGQDPEPPASIGTVCVTSSPPRFGRNRRVF